MSSGLTLSDLRDRQHLRSMQCSIAKGLRSNQLLHIHILMLSCNVCFEVVKPWPPLKTSARTRSWTGATDMARLFPHLGFDIMHRLPMSFEVVSSREACFAWARMMCAPERLGMCEFVLAVGC